MRASEFVRSWWIRWGIWCEVLVALVLIAVPVVAWWTGRLQWPWALSIVAILGLWGFIGRYLLYYNVVEGWSRLLNIVWSVLGLVLILVPFIAWWRGRLQWSWAVLISAALAMWSFRRDLWRQVDRFIRDDLRGLVSTIQRWYERTSAVARSWWRRRSAVVQMVSGLILTASPLVLWWLGAIEPSWGFFVAVLFGIVAFGRLPWTILDWTARALCKWTDRPVGETFARTAIDGCSLSNERTCAVTDTATLPQSAKCPLAGCPADEPPPHEPDLTGCLVKIDRRASFRNLMGWFCLFYLLSATLFYELYSPAAAICLLLGMLAIMVAAVGYRRPRRRLLYLFAFVGYIGLVNNQNDKNRFKYMDSYYSKPVRLRDKTDFIYKPFVATVARQVRDPDQDREGVGAKLVDNESSLAAWRANAARAWSQVKRGPTKPKMVIVSVSGGAARSAYWSALVLERLSQILDAGQPKSSTFESSIRIITGTSGGMVGTAYYVERRYRERIGSHPGMARWVDELPYDSLTPLARYIMLRDLPRSLFPRFFHSKGTDGWVEEFDRGTFLEELWEYLGDRPLQHYANEEQQGKLPSLILSPMMVEDGRLLLITNLDLSAVPLPQRVLTKQPFPVGPGFPPQANEFGSGKKQVMVISAGSKLTEDEDGTAVGSFSLSGLEFFKLFPNATRFRLATAVRMNATFPFVSPAVALPTIPPRHVVDAGYYDNYGVQVSTAWIHMNRQWLSENTSGVLLVQIRDGLSVFDRWEIDDRDASAADILVQGYHFLFSPLRGAAKARSTTAMFRNDRDIEHLSDWFTLVTGHREFFTTLVLENPAAIAVLTPRPDPTTLPGEKLIKITGKPKQLASALDAKLAERDRLTQLAEDGMGIEYQAADISMNWYLNSAERLAMDRTLPDPEHDAGAKETPDDAQQRIDRKKILEDLVMTLKNTPRDFALRELVKIRNYARIIKLKYFWWDKDHSPDSQVESNIPGR